jgi:hypothetical protein
MVNIRFIWGRFIFGVFLTFSVGDSWLGCINQCGNCVSPHQPDYCWPSKRLSFVEDIYAELPELAA